MSAEAPAAAVAEEADTPDHFFARAWGLANSSWSFRLGLIFCSFMLLLAIVGPYISRYPLNEASTAANVPPGSNHWFGTDPSGLDIFSRVVAAPRIDVTIALAATALSAIVGSAIGLGSAYFRGWLGEATMRVVDMAQAFPLFVFAIVIVVMSGRNVWNIVLVASLLNVPIYIRLVRSQVLSLRERAFVEASRAAGNSELATAIRYVFPNAAGPVIAQAPITMGYTILVTAGLSFIGAGVRPPTPEWGGMIASGTGGLILDEWWTSVFPGIAISLAVLSFAIVGEGLHRLVFRRSGGA